LSLLQEQKSNAGKYVWQESGQPSPGLAVGKLLITSLHLLQHHMMQAEVQYTGIGAPKTGGHWQKQQ